MNYLQCEEPTADTGACEYNGYQAPQSVVDEYPLRIVVGIEDKAIRTGLCALLRRDGYSVVAVEDGYHLVQLLADAILYDTERRPNLIVADALMRGCTGSSLSAGIRDLGWKTPIILLADSKSPTARMASLRRGLTRVFPKPIAVEKLRLEVHAVLAGVPPRHFLKNRDRKQPLGDVSRRRFRVRPPAVPVEAIN